MGKLGGAVLLRDECPNDGRDSQNNQKENGQVDRAKEIPDEILKILRRWSNDGTIFGSWQHQYEKVTNQE